jgi:hypothetical protein
MTDETHIVVEADFWDHRNPVEGISVQRACDPTWVTVRIDCEYMSAGVLLNAKQVDALIRVLEISKERSDDQR